MSRRTVDTLQAEIPLKPIAWARTADHKGRRYNPKRYAEWKATAAQWLALGARYARIEGEVSVLIDLYPDKVAVSVARLDEPRRAGSGLTGDVDNYSKAVLDALQTAGILADDAQAAEVHVRIRKARA